MESDAAVVLKFQALRKLLNKKCSRSHIQLRIGTPKGYECDKNRFVIMHFSTAIYWSESIEEIEKVVNVIVTSFIIGWNRNVMQKFDKKALKK